MKTSNLEKILGYGGMTAGVVMVFGGYLMNNYELYNVGACVYLGSAVYYVIKVIELPSKF